MNRKVKFILAGLGLILLQSCSSCGIEATCEDTNWFEYGQKIAFEGRYLEEDPMVRQCKEVDKLSAQQIDLGFKLGRDKMCNYTEIRNRGKSGKTVFFDFCDGLEKRKMNEVYQDGLKEFCTSESGYLFGKSGQEYAKVCSKEQEVLFLPQYFQGRKEYLKAQIKDIRELAYVEERQLLSLERSESSISSNLDRLSNFARCSNKAMWDEGAKKNVNRYICEEPDYISSQRKSLNDELKETRSSLSKMRNSYKDKISRLEWYQQELNKIP